LKNIRLVLVEDGKITEWGKFIVELMVRNN